jgi:hypothetical protein
MSNHKGGRAAILLILAGTLGVGALAYYVKSTPDASRVPDEIRVVRNQESHPKPEATIEASETKPNAEKEPTRTIHSNTVRIPVFGDDISDMGLDKRETPVPSGQDGMRFVAQRIADAAHFDGARVLGVEVRDHVAIVKYNGAVAKGMGSMEEGLFLRALQVGFGQFTQIDKVTVESDGQPLQSGHVDLGEPLPVVRPGATPPVGGEPTHAEP